MTMETLGIKNKGLLLFGIILLLIGLGASLYAQVRYSPVYIDEYGNKWGGEENSRTYPYQSIGMVLVLAGIIFVAIGFFYSPRKRESL